jgi:hypothetical protein
LNIPIVIKMLKKSPNPFERRGVLGQVVEALKIFKKKNKSADLKEHVLGQG